MEGPQQYKTEPPRTPRTASPRGHHSRNSSLFRSPVNLPIRSEISPDSSPRNGSRFSSPRSPIRQPARTPDQKVVSPRRSFYLDKSVPVPGDEQVASPEIPSLDKTAHPDLIFDDGDGRLPRSQASPTYRPSSDADVLAISSPVTSTDGRIDLEEIDLEEDHDYEYGQEPLSTNKTFEPWKRSANLSISSAPIMPSDSMSINGMRSSSSPSPFYPIHIPTKLMRPPKLSSKHSHGRSSTPMDHQPPPPHWEASPLEHELEFFDPQEAAQLYKNQILSLGHPNEDGEDLSDVDSDRATVMSDDRDEFEFPVGDEDEERGDEKPGSKSKSKKWLSKLFSKKNYKSLGETKDEMGEKYDGKEAEAVQGQMANLDTDLAFSRLDPETIQRHSQMFNAGGLHNGVAPRTGGPTSLIEELEIRKAGKRIQKQVFFREIIENERQRAEDVSNHIIAHPADVVHNVQPTLMQMQTMADVDYNARVEWHKRAINRHYIQENGNETLAQRRARLKAEKSKGTNNSPHQQNQEETLAQRRQRLKQKTPARTESIYSGNDSVAEEIRQVPREGLGFSDTELNSPITTEAY